MKEALIDYTEPVTGGTFQFALLPRHSLRNSPYQREYSSTLVNRLVNSVAHGFVNPVVVVPSGDHYLVIDGQHRLGSLDKAITDDNPSVPCIILPEGYRDLPLFWNIEKTDNIKDKAAKIYKLYTDKVGQDLTEFDLSPSSNHEPYIFSLAFSFVEHGLKSPSLVESPVKKVDNQIIQRHNSEGYKVSVPLSEGIEIRRERGALAKRLEEIVEETAAEYGVSDFNLKRSIVSQASQALWGRKRKIAEEPEEALPALTEQIGLMDWSWMEGR